MELQISNVTKKYAELYALQDFSVTFTNGVYGLLGPNGAGKTTLFNIILGIISQDSGKVCLDGIDIRKMGNAYYSHIGYLPQYTQFYKNYSCQEFLDYICVLKGQNKRIIKKKVSGLLELVNLQDVSKKKIGALSGGMRQRLGIAQALVNDPGILVLDEPTAALDPIVECKMYENFAQIFSNHGAIMISHRLASAKMADRILVLDKGKIVEEGTHQQLMEKKGVYEKMYTVQTAWYKE